MTGSAAVPRPGGWLSRAGYVLMAVLVGTFVVSTLPGVRSHTGYDLLLDGWLNNVAYGLAPLVCWLRARRAASYRSSWRILALGLALYGLGNVYWTVLIRPQDPEPFPSGADALWLSFYPCAFAALLLVVRERTRRLPVSLWLDGVVGGLAVAAGAATAILGPVLASSGGGSLAATVTTTAYPLLDLLLLLVTVASLALFHWRPPRGLWLLAAGLIVFVVADAIYLVSVAHNSYAPGGPNDAAWVVATVCMGFAPGWPDRPAGLRLPAWALLGIPVVATLGALALLVGDRGHRMHPVAIGLAAATVVAALARLMVTFREATVLAHSHQLALTDELTGLGNRRAFYEHAQARLDRTEGQQAALLLLDLDRFKEVNDSLGHQAGDVLLRQVARRLAGCVSGERDLLARLGGDEFAVLALGVDVAGAQVLAERIRAGMQAPYTVDEVTVHVDVSIGIAVAAPGDAEVPNLLRQADIAMYQAKSRGTGFCIYSVDRDLFGGQDRLRTIQELRRAVTSRSLVVHYQPKVDARSHRVTGVEALVRWQHPTRGLLYPDAFLPLVEDAGLMYDLTIAVLEQSLDQVEAWRAAGRDLTVAVNLSASCLVDAELPDRVLELLAARALPPALLELEITEDFLMGDRERARGILARLREAGIRVAVDDFGTGYSSLAYLRELPIDELKLDRSFVFSMDNDPRAAAIVRSTIDLAHSLGLRLVAEGVENAATAQQLATSGCDEAQGFFYSRALPSPYLEAWLDEHAAGTDAVAEQGPPALPYDGPPLPRSTEELVGGGAE